MDNDSENNAKISDSAYSNSCSNSQSRRSHSSKSTHSGSNSSGSSGYGGKPSTSSSSNKVVQTSKKDKDGKKKRSHLKALEKPALLECRPPEPLIEVPKINEEKLDVEATPPISLPENAVENIITLSDLGTNKDEISNNQMGVTVVEAHYASGNNELEGFSCAISMQDGVVMYTTQNLSANLGFPKEMWIGRSFIDFVHPQDRNTFASQITNGLALPKIVNGTQEKAQPQTIQESTMVCRIRRYRGLSAGFLVKDRSLTYVPFVLKFSFKEIKDNEGNIVYLIIKAIPLYSAYKTPNEVLLNPSPFVIRHSATGNLEYIDIESVPYLGYLPQDIHNHDALMMYHPDDLPYMQIVYETIVKEGGMAKSMPYRMMAQNGDYVKLETEWSSFINPWSMKLEFVIGKHIVLEGPTITDVFKTPAVSPAKPSKISDTDRMKTELANSHKANILSILKDVLTKPAEKAKQQINKRCQELATIMESLLEEPKQTDGELRNDSQETDLNCCERDSVMLGGISPHHEYNDSMSSTGTPLSYNQLNYNENLQRYFDSHLNYRFETNSPPMLVAGGSSAPKDYRMTEGFAKSQMSPMAQHSTDSQDISPGSSINNSYSPPASTTDFLLPRLTESLLTKHNNDMEKELAKIHREGRSNNKAERFSDNRQKKKEHLARCNATFQPTRAGAFEEAIQPHTLKRHLKNSETEIPTKQHCPRHCKVPSNTPAPPQRKPPPTSVVGIPLPNYYPPTVVPVTTRVDCQPSSSEAHSAQNLPYPQISHLDYQPTHMPWMYPQPVYGTPYMYSPMQYSLQQQIPPTIFNQRPATSGKPTEVRPLTSSKEPVPKAEEKPVIVTQITEPEPSKLRDFQSHEPVVEKEFEKPAGPSDEDMYRTDGESSYSSIYSSFFRTETGSFDSSDPKKPRMDVLKKDGEVGETFDPHGAKKTPRRKMDPPWMEQVRVTSDLLYKYQVPSKTKDQVLKEDLIKMKLLAQPAMVNDQLGQLYLDLQLEGVTSRLTLEEGITSSSSSGEEGFNVPKPAGSRRKREYSKLNMIYEEDAPLPPPMEDPVPPSPGPSEMENADNQRSVS